MPREIFTAVMAWAAYGQLPPEAIVDAVDGRKPAAPLIGIRADFSLELGGAPTIVPGKNLIALRQTRVPIPAPCPPPFLALTTGDLLPLAKPIDVRLEDDSLRAALAAPFDGAPFVVPQAAIASIGLAPADDFLAEVRGGDAVVLKNGDRLAGRLASIDPREGVRLSIGGEEKTIPFDRVAAIALNPELQSRPKIAGAFAELILAGGGRLAAAKLESTAKGSLVTATSLLGQRFAFSPGQIASLRMRRAKAIYLDELKPSAYEATPFLDVSWPLSIGKTSRGDPLRLGGDTYPLGVAMHSRSRATYAVPPGAVRFEALVGIDPQAGPKGMAATSLEIDGKPAPHTAKLLKADAPPVWLQLDLKGAKAVTLVTDFGPLGDVQGHALWTDARFVLK